MDTKKENKDCLSVTISTGKNGDEEIKVERKVGYSVSQSEEGRQTSSVKECQVIFDIRDGYIDSVK